MNDREHVLRAGALGAGLSTLMLVGMAFIAFPGGESYPGLSVLTGGIDLTLETLREYRLAIQWLFFLDGLFLLGWLLAWLGLAEVIRPRFTVLAWLTLAFGVTGALFDFAENSIIWSAAQNLAVGQAVDMSWLLPWRAVQHLSYWLPFIGAVLASVALWSGSRMQRGVAWVGALLVVPAVAGLYFPALSLLSNLWFLLWFAGLCGLLWRHSSTAHRTS